MKRLAIITTHPIQYNAPLFALLASRKQVSIKVFYTWGPAVMEDKFDPGFNKKIQWDIPILEGYDYEFVTNKSLTPGSHHFKGIDNPQLIESVEKWGAEAILVYGWSFKSHLKVIRYFHGKIPVLFRGDSTLLNKQEGIKKLARKFFLKWVYSYVDYALFVGTNNKNYYLKHGLKENQLILALHAIDNDRFSEPDLKFTTAANEWKKQLKVNEGELTIVYAGKLDDNKNPDFIIELGKQLNNLPVKFIFVGNGEVENKLKLSVKNNEKFIFVDFQNQLIMPVVYRLGDFFILPSKSETWGLGANEAMASGVPVMLSNQVGGAVDLVDEGVNGIVFKLNDVEKCAAFITTIIIDPELLLKMKLAAKEKIKQFSFLNIAKSIEVICSKT